MECSTLEDATKNRLREVGLNPREFEGCGLSISQIEALIYRVLKKEDGLLSCNHNTMIPNNDPNNPDHVWKCAECGYVYN
jgi:hypothetical protein